MPDILTDAKPCPFCGHNPLLYAPGAGEGNWEISCNGDDCPANPSVEAATKENVFKLWNLRLTEVEAQEMDYE